MVKKKKMPVFGKICLISTAVFLIALGVWLYFLYGWLGDFEASQPKYVVEDTFEKYFASFDAAEYVQLCGVDEDSFEKKEDVIAYLKSVTDGKEITCKKVASGLEGGQKYMVIASDGEKETKFASFVLTEKEGKGSFSSYVAGNFEIYTDSENTVYVEAPKGYKVEVNGKELSEKYIQEKDIPTPSCDFMPEGVSGLLYTKYALRTLGAEPEIKVFDKNGAEAPLEKEEKKYKATPVYDQELAEEYSEWVLEGSVLYARYSQYDEFVNKVSFKEVAPYFDPGSELYESIRTLENDFVQYYDRYEFEDKSAGEFLRYDENTFSCRVKYTQYMYSKNDVYTEEIDQTLYLRNVDGEYLIYKMQVNAD